MPIHCKICKWKIKNTLKFVFATWQSAKQLTGLCRWIHCIVLTVLLVCVLMEVGVEMCAGGQGVLCICNQARTGHGRAYQQQTHIQTNLTHDILEQQKWQTSSEVCGMYEKKKRERERKKTQKKTTQSWLDVHVGDTGWRSLQIYSEWEIQMMTDVVTKNLLRNWEERSG